MLRTIWLTMQNEARLLLSDPIVLFMLLLAPIVIIAVAGYSLGNIYGGLAGSFRIPVVDLDHGPMAVAIIDALRANPAVVIETTRDEEQARKSVSERARTPIAIVIPAGTSDAIARGRVPNLTLYIDPVRRVEVDGLEVKIAELCRKIGEHLQGEAQKKLDSATADLIESPGPEAQPKLPGSLSFTEQSAIKGEPTVVNAFDQYLPGFGITFLLIGMMLGLALTLFDERDWGTLKRLQVGGAPLTGLLLGKLFGRFFVGIAQMVSLFAVGWALFGISLGRNPLALIIPTVGISFAAAALALVVASIATAHDSVMSLGVTISMAMAAIGGCWWPLDFEPGWMRELARWLPTTWTMQAFNDLMIRNQPPSAALLPLAATIGIGVIFIVAGLLRFLSLED
jgi:ABC-2 type transport system permease protein